MKLTVKAFAKLNLTLDILETLPNGYHSIESIFQSVSLHDILYIESGTKEISVTCSDPNIPQGKDNICYKAIETFLKHAGINDGVSVHIEKHIPEAAGMGGGSADAAATLLALSQIYRHILDNKELWNIAMQLGADVPFCMAGGACIARGTGEILTPISSCPDCDIVLVKQGTKPSTAELYKRFDMKGSSVHPDTAAAILALEAENLEDVADNIANCFSPLWGESVSKIKSDMLMCGALAAELTGSGPTVFGFFKKGKGQAALEFLKKRYPIAYLCHPTKSGVEFVKKEI